MGYVEVVYPISLREMQLSICGLLYDIGIRYDTKVGSVLFKSLREYC